ncbi:MAG: alpha/beta hydrolase [Oscillospiraceae bacterium]|nr:alpha/beta hydrolase [Oscillospiraceae bacterium]
MLALWIILGVVIALALMIVLFSYLCFRMAFYSPDRPATPSDAIDIPEGEAYIPFRENMEKWARDLRAMPHEEMSITSFDGLTLRGKFYEYAPNAPIELMFHGYRGTAERDLSGGVARCFQLGRSALLVDQRGCSDSEGNVISFGINEHRDCLAWLDFAIQRFGKDAKIILTGISMGASTVLMVSDQALPPNVLGILADCGFSSAKDIIKRVIRQMGLPADVGYPFVKLGAKLFGHFDLEAHSAVETVKHATVPVIFFHGDGDDYVPCEMSRINYEACTAKKKLVIIPRAGHGLSYPVAPDTYLNALREFFGEEASYKG